MFEFDCAILIHYFIISRRGRIPLLLSSRTTVQKARVQIRPSHCMHPVYRIRVQLSNFNLHHGRWSPLTSTGTDPRPAPQPAAGMRNRSATLAYFSSSRRFPGFVKLSLVKHQSLTGCVVCCPSSWPAPCRYKMASFTIARSLADFFLWRERHKKVRTALLYGHFM